MLEKAKRLGLSIGAGETIGLVGGTFVATFLSQVQMVSQNHYTVEPQMWAMGIGTIVGAFIGMLFELGESADNAKNASRIYRELNLGST